jgi:two-component system OmpR family response regulator
MGEIKVLCVDDEEELVSAWVERLLMRGIEAEGVTNGIEAIQRVKDKQYDVVVLDIKMPGIDGFEIMKRMKTVRSNLPIILITGHQSMEDENKKMLAGAFDCLVKPVDIDVLVGKIIKAVKIEESKK